LLRNPKLQSLFEPVFIARVPDWNRLVRSFLRTKPETVAKWKVRRSKVLNAKGYEEGEVKTYLEALTANRSFLERQSFLFDPNDRARRDNR
jgi:hypothetical protein